MHVDESCVVIKKNLLVKTERAGRTQELPFGTDFVYEVTVLVWKLQNSVKIQREKRNNHKETQNDTKWAKRHLNRDWKTTTKRLRVTIRWFKMSTHGHKWATTSLKGRNVSQNDTREHLVTKCPITVATRSMQTYYSKAQSLDLMQYVLIYWRLIVLKDRDWRTQTI